MQEPELYTPELDQSRSGTSGRQFDPGVETCGHNCKQNRQDDQKKELKKRKNSDMKGGAELV